MTAKWEQRLYEIGEGKAFMEQVKKLTVKLIDDARENSKSWDFSKIQLQEIEVDTIRGKKKNTFENKILHGKCLLCGGTVIDKGNFYGCGNYTKTKCSFSISKKILGKTISKTNVEKILQNGKSNLIKGFKKGNNTFNAYLIWNNKEKKIKFAYE